MSILEYIDYLKRNSGFSNAAYVFTHGKCLIFAKLLNQIYTGDILFLPTYNHFVFRFNNKLYDATGCVTKIYSGEKLVSLDTLSKKQLIGYEGA